MVSLRINRVNDVWDSRISKEVTFYNKLKERLPSVVIKDLTPILDDMRWVKDQKEIAVIRECGRIGCLGINEAIKVTRPGIYEYQTVAACDFIYEDMGTAGPAYYAIAASGERGLIWHYNANNHLLEAGTVLLIDYAPELNYYTTDITRTWPVEGEFTAEQLKFYNCVREARDEIIKAMKPGVGSRRSAFTKTPFFPLLRPPWKTPRGGFPVRSMASITRSICRRCSTDSTTERPRGDDSPALTAAGSAPVRPACWLDSAPRPQPRITPARRARMGTILRRRNRATFIRGESKLTLL